MIEQAGIVIFSLLGALMLARGRYRLGFALSLAAQPFWLYSTWEAGQAGAFIVSLVFAFAWAAGLKRCWRKEVK
jgi:cytochrome c biogenesis protein CcdA